MKVGGAGRAAEMATLLARCPRFRGSMESQLQFGNLVGLGRWTGCQAELGEHPVDVFAGGGRLRYAHFALAVSDRANGQIGCVHAAQRPCPRVSRRIGLGAGAGFGSSSESWALGGGDSRAHGTMACRTALPQENGP